MALQVVQVEVTGKTPLLMRRYPLAPVEGIDKQPADVQAEESAYRTPDGELYVPGVNVQRALVAGAVFSKGKGRASLQKVAAACLMVTPEYILIDPQTYTIDSRAVVIPATKGRVVRHRPRFDHWQIAFELEYDDVLMSMPQVRQIVDDTLSRVGLLDFRPEKKGSFGRGMVTGWET